MAVQHPFWAEFNPVFCLGILKLIFKLNCYRTNAVADWAPLSHREMALE